MALPSGDPNVEERLRPRPRPLPGPVLLAVPGGGSGGSDVALTERDGDAGVRAARKTFTLRLTLPRLRRPAFGVREVAAALPEPDYRFSLANERTFLAYVRTALAMMAAGIGVAKFLPGDDFSLLRHTLGVLLAVLGVVVAATAYGRYRGVQNAIRRGRPLPPATALPVVGLSLAIGAVIAVLLVLV